jgi:hypothetical protein
MKYMVCINDNEARDNGSEMTFNDVLDEVEELLRSGYYEVEWMDEVDE